MKTLYDIAAEQTFFRGLSTEYLRAPQSQNQFRRRK